MIKIGILGTGRIAHRFMSEVLEVPELKPVLVMNPHIESAKSFAEKYGIQNTVSAVVSCVDKVDAVYIASPHETHFQYALFFLEQGIHVLCEKPLCFSKQEAEQLYTVAKKHQCILMEAVKTAYCPGFMQILSVIKEGKIGKLCDIEACFSRLYTTDSREVWDLQYGGSFTEFGSYCLLPVVKLAGTGSNKIHFWSLQGATNVDIYIKGVVTYPDCLATVKTGLGVKSEGQLIIAGTGGYILVPSPWWLTNYYEIHYEDASRIERYEVSFEGSGLRYELRMFADQINAMHLGDWETVMHEEGMLTPEESIWMAAQMEIFFKQCRKTLSVTSKQNRLSEQDHLFAQKQPNVSDLKIKIWGHRGCSTLYPENTLSAFQAAAELDGITGIELDTQLTQDGEVVVIHDETVNRTSDGTGRVVDYTLEQLKQLEIAGRDGRVEWIPTLREVFQLLEPYCKGKHLMINIELKNSVIRYESMEEKVLQLVKEFGLEEYIIYSSFFHASLGLLKELDSTVQTATLAGNIHDCIQGAKAYHADALHPSVSGLDSVQCHYNLPVRAWGGDEILFGQERIVKDTDMTRYSRFGVTDLITNMPEKYVGRIEG